MIIKPGNIRLKRSSRVGNVYVYTGHDDLITMLQDHALFSKNIFSLKEKTADNIFATPVNRNRPFQVQLHRKDTTKFG